MYARSPTHEPETGDDDQRVIMRGMTWKDYEVVLAVRGDRAGVRMYYLDGEMELMSPSRGHEGNKTLLARLLELWALETDTSLEGFGSWTLKEAAKDAGAEPDECYIVGDASRRDRPDLVIEVEWSRGGLSKQEIYARLEVPELWLVDRRGRVTIHVLESGKYARSTKSRLLPELDVAWLAAFGAAASSQTAAVKALRGALREPHKKAKRTRRH